MARPAARALQAVPTSNLQGQGMISPAMPLVNPDGTPTAMTFRFLFRLWNRPVTWDSDTTWDSAPAAKEPPE
jgi:hypothetical protein